LAVPKDDTRRYYNIFIKIIFQPAFYHLIAGQMALFFFHKSNHYGKVKADRLKLPVPGS